MTTSEVRIRELAEKQSGVVSRRQALALGATNGLIYRRLDAGIWTRLESGTYLVFGQASRQARLAAATFHLPAVVSHQSAGCAHRLDIAEPAIPVVTIPHRFSNRFPGIALHESTDLEANHIVEVDGLPTTTVSRTLFDLGSVLGPTAHGRLVERSLVQRQVTLAGLSSILSQIGRRGRPGTKNMRRMLESLGVGYVATESELERRMIQLLTEAGLPLPNSQVELAWRTNLRYRVDFVYPTEKVIIECDGRSWHSTADAFERDRRRDNLAQLDHWRVLRFTWKNVVEDPDETVAQIRAALASPPT